MTTPPIIPGHPDQDPPPQYYPQPYYPPQPPPGYYQPAPQSDPNVGIRKAGTIAVWLWIVLTLIPLAVVVLCIGMCLFGGIVGSVSDSESSR